MNTVCPGFVPHHVKPNRCRRCFKDIHDHDSEVTTSFTLPLPRRRRESVATAETPKSEEVEATFTISEATSSGRRTRQRSSSTSSWFQEKKVDEEHKERIDTLFRNADDSRASYNSRREDDDQPDAVAVVRMPPVRRRQGEDVDVKGDPRSLLTRLSEVRKTNDVSAKPPELPPKTLDSLKLKKSDLLKQRDDSGQSLADSKPSWTRRGAELSGKSTDSRFDPVRRADVKVGDRGADSQLSSGTLGKSEISSRSSDSRLDPVKKPEATLEAKDADKRSGSRFGSAKSDLSSSSYLKSKFEPEATSKSEDSGKVSNEKPQDSKLDEKKTTSKFGEVKLKDSKFGEVKLRDTKVSELRSRASKFESPTSKTTKEPSKTAAEAVPAESKSEPKPVLARFSSLRGLDTKTSPVVVAPKTTDKNAAFREPTRLGDEVSVSSKDSETSKSKPSAVTEEQKPKPIEVRNSTVKDKPNVEIPKAEEVQQTQGQQQQWESRISELQSSVSQLRRRLEESEDACCMLEREKADLQKQQKDRLEQDRQALERTASELAKMRAKLAEMQSAQDLARKTKQELKDAKENLNRKEAEWNKKESEWKRKESELNKREPPETKLHIEQLKQELKDTKAELTRKEAEWSQRELELCKKEPATRQSVDQLKKDLREAKAELSRKEAEWNKKDIEWSLKESAWSKAKAELSKSDSGPMQNVEQLKQELKDAKAEWNKKEAEWSKKEAEWSKKEPLTKLNSVEDLKKDLREFKAEMSKKESEWRKREIEWSKKEIELKKKDAEWTKKESEWNRKESEYIKREPAAKLSVEQLKKELKDAKAELSRREAELSKRDSGPKLGTDQLKQKLAQSEALCEELAEENEEIKKEVRDLEQELEELHDNFREDQASEFRGLKRELEGATKNCRVLQFKLRKAEKKAELLEIDRHALEDKVREYQAAVRQDVDRSKLKELEQELGMQRSLAASLHEEVQVLKEALGRAEAEKTAPRSATPVAQSLLPGHLREGLLGKDHEALSHELYDTMEREGDLREQLRFSEEEARNARRKMSALEQENETLVLQIKKLTAIVKTRSPASNAAKALKGEEAEEEASSEELKMQLEMQEQELSVVRRKLDDAEREAENLQSEVKYLQEKVINQPLVEVPELPKESGGGAYWEHKARQQDYEIRETRRRLIEKDREIERLHTEVEVHRRKAARMMVRSRSLDSDLQVDLKRQLQLVEQEAGMLRQKVSSLEAEGDKLGAENKRMTLRLSKKAPPSSAELLQLDNLELKEKMEEQQRKLEALMEKTRADSNPVTVIQDYKPLKESLSSLMSENEHDLIGSLKRKLRSREEEQAALQAKAAQLQAENDRLGREFRRLKESLAERRRPPAKAVREAATRIELREIVSELQDEISDLQVNLRSREVLQEGLEEEAERARKELRDAAKELQQKEEKLAVQLEAARAEKEALKKELEAQRSRTANAEEALQGVGGVGGGKAAGGVEQAKRISTLSQEKREAERRAAAAEEALALRTQRLREAQEALAAASSLREDLARSNRSLEAQKADVEKELEEHRNLLTKAEGRAAELRSQVDRTDRDLTSLRKECNQLRNELEDERGRLKQSSDRKQSEASSGWSREREGLRRIENELRNRIEHLQHQVTDNEKIWIEKESRMRDDFKKKKDGAVREAREKGEAALELAKAEEKILRGRAQELAEKLEKLEGSLKEATEKSRHLVSQHRRDREEWAAEREALEASGRAEQKRRERLEREQEQALAAKEEELLRSRERLVAMEREQRRSQMQIEEVESLQQKVRQLEKEADKARAEYDLITAKYDQLEDEFVKTKASLVADKELTETSLLCLKRDYNELSFELTSLKGTYNARQDNWIKEKLDLQERLKELTRRLERLKLVEQERRRLQDEVEEKEASLQTCRKEEKQLKDEREKLGKRVEELTKMLVAQQQPVGPAGGVGEAARRRPDELEATRRDYEARMAIMASEISSMQAQIGALAAERDDLRAQLSSAERSAEEVRSGSLKRERARHREEADAARRKVHELRFQLEDLREQLEDAQLENRNLKLQIETDKNTFDFQAAELKSKINQLEEQKILESTRGQTRSIAKTRLELAWEKERAELQLLLAESHRLGLELKERVQGGDGDRDRERQAVRKQMLEMRSATEKERQESKRKMTELHSSLLEIRESHAKLRGMYDRMKKERELLLRERDEWRQRLQGAAQLHAHIAQLAQDFDKVTSQVSDNSGKTPLNADLKESVQKVKESFVELQTSAAVLKEDEKLKRTTSFRRAVSAQEVNRPGDPLGRWQNPQRVTDYPLAPPSMLLRPPPRQKALQRKSLSLDQALSQEARLKIWESEGESACSTPGGGSLLSLGGYGYETDSSLPDSEYRYGGVGQDRRRYRPPSAMTSDSEAMSSREGSVDPGGSVESVPLQHQRRTLKDKLKLLRRTKSIDVASGRKEEPSGSGKVEKELSLRHKISKVLRMGRTDGQKPALPPRGATPDLAPPRRPTAEKPLSASRGDLSAKTTDSASKSAKSAVEKSATAKSAAAKSATDKSAAAKKGRETPV